MITASAKGGSFLLAHPPGESSLQRDIFFIRVIWEIRGSHCFFQGKVFGEHKSAAVFYSTV